MFYLMSLTVIHYACVLVHVYMRMCMCVGTCTTNIFSACNYILTYICLSYFSYDVLFNNLYVRKCWRLFKGLLQYVNIRYDFVPQNILYLLKINFCSFTVMCVKLVSALNCLVPVWCVLVRLALYVFDTNLTLVLHVSNSDIIQALYVSHTNITLALCISDTNLILAFYISDIGI